MVSFPAWFSATAEHCMSFLNNFFFYEIALFCALILLISYFIQKFPSHGISKAPSLPSPISASAFPQSQHMQQPLVSSQGKLMHAPSVPSSSSSASSLRPQPRPQVLQPRPYHLLQSPSTTPQQQSLSSSQQQQIQQQQLQQKQQLLQQPQQLTSAGSQLSQEHQQYLALRNQQALTLQQAARNVGSTAHKSSAPLAQAGVVQSGAVTPVSTDDVESDNHILSKRSIRELVSQVLSFSLNFMFPNYILVNMYLDPSSVAHC